MIPDYSLTDGELAHWIPIGGELSVSHAVLWTVILLTSLFDVVTTTVGLELGLREGNAVARALVESYGVVGLAALKIGALLVVALVWAALDEHRSTAALVGFALVSSFVVALNTIALVTFL
ncbi:DUF5658 family protein [Haloarcula nitratireducens]|uniref:DUF5658 family protein n=1 Tax=Haloarcula nitratireducens TaxID=2487749 RepID=A0AAW4PEN2_9EURY|nr:DUF5658 family protein [Halomicroarcula nitratireducens]MBX0296294.1 DUF5658 family protein [Halomicroarcula nitratireducens]